MPTEIIDPLTDAQINELAKLQLGDRRPKWSEKYLPDGCTTLEPILLGMVLYYRNLLWDAEDTISALQRSAGSILQSQEGTKA